MSCKRIGEILSGLVPLSGHDIEEILSEQSATRQRFGDIALAMGLCRPEHIWKACSTQLDSGPRRIDLGALGIDSGAVEHVSAEIARRYCAVPVRVMADQLVVAVEESSLEGAAAALQGHALKVNFVLADREQIEQAIATYYPATFASRAEIDAA